MKRIVWLLMSYWRTRRLAFSSRADVEAYQARKLRDFCEELCESSAYFAPLHDLPLAQWPTMDKAVMTANFDTMNTAGLALAQVMAAAMEGERSRDFKPAVSDITVGLSSGTSSQRGVFAVSDKEKAQWAGVMLAKALPAGLFSGERVALFLRANSNLYEAVRTPWLQFSFFDLFQSFASLTAALVVYKPTVIVAPAQVLRELALAVLAGQLALSPKRVISVAEVLEPQDRVLIERAFGQVHEIYQATEGFLASTCERGVLHLNEEYVHVEPQWLDPERRRFVPLITDFSRMTQPVVRYRLDDVLVARPEPCGCGRATRAIERIEGRCDDMLSLPGIDGTRIAVFADLLSRALAQSLPAEADYRLTQTGEASLRLCAPLGPAPLEAVRLHLDATLQGVGVDTGRLAWSVSETVPPFDPSVKRRRIRRESA
ncbi:MAG: F390 synthetase-related protein [Pseudomonadota bacterium]